MNLPDFIVAGVAKCGTTSLCNYLDMHPNVTMSQPKELDFFGRKGIENNLDNYSRHFEKSKGTITGEGSVSYMLYSELAAKQISEHIPDVKLIIMLRNPIDRFYSDFWFNINRGAVLYKKGLFEGVIDNTMIVPYSKVHKMSYRESLITKGYYAEHLKNYLRYFDRKNIKIIFFEELNQDRQAVLNSVFEFLGVKNANIEAPTKIYNKTKYPGKLNLIYIIWKRIKPLLPQKQVVKYRGGLKRFKDMLFSDKKPEFSDAARKKLFDIYENSIMDLEVLINKDLSHWK